MIDDSVWIVEDLGCSWIKIAVTVIYLSQESRDFLANSFQVTLPESELTKVTIIFKMLVSLGIVDRLPILSHRSIAALHDFIG